MNVRVCMQSAIIAALQCRHLTPIMALILCMPSCAGGLHTAFQWVSLKYLFPKGTVDIVRLYAIVDNTGFVSFPRTEEKK